MPENIIDVLTLVVDPLILINERSLVKTELESLIKQAGSVTNSSGGSSELDDDDFRRSVKFANTLVILLEYELLANESATQVMSTSNRIKSDPVESKSALRLKS